jgi:TPR repeat protein
MKSLWMIALPISCVALICGAAVTWHFVEARATERKLAEDAKACRVRAEQADAKAQSDLAGMYYHGKGVPQDYAEAVHWYRKGADQGNAKAQYGLGFMYYEGKGVPQDYAEAARWFRKAADQDAARAQDGLGSMYFQGKGAPQDYAEAARWYRKAADHGDEEGQDALGFMYYQGKGVPQDYAGAVGWYRKAADHGYAKAQYDLGNMYYQGKGAPQDYVEAARWYRKAANQGDEYARRALSSMKISLSARSKINLSLVFLGSLVILIRWGGIRGRQRQRTTLTGLLGLSWVGLDLYGYSHFGILQSLSAVNAFYFGKSVLSGICIAMLISLVWSQGTKIMLRVCGLLFIGFNSYAIAHYDLGHLAPLLRAFYSANGLLIGMAIPLTIFLWLEGEKTRGSQNDNDGVAPGPGTEPLRM